MIIHASAHAKINWALNIVGRRGDGYHLLDMLMQEIDLCDAMSFEDAEGLSLRVDGVLAGDENLVMRAAKALSARCGGRRGAAMSLEKRIPARAGMGGGSADCAVALKALNRLWGLGLSDAELSEIGVGLGADVPFCLAGGLARVTGIGEDVSPIVGAPRIPLALVTPGGGLSTAEVFRLWDERFPPAELDVPALAEAVVRRDLKAVDRLCANALTAPAIELMPEIGDLMRTFRALGAGAVFMTGSGSTVVAAFEGGEQARRAAEKVDGARVAYTTGM